MISFRTLRPCDRCAEWPACEFLRSELELAVARVNRVAAFADRRLPDGEVVFDCCGFRPRQLSRDSTVP